jgi:hypothetical protein
MNNIDKVTELQRIISTAQDDLAKLMKQKGKRFKPGIDEEYWYVDEIGVAIDTGWRDSPFDRLCFNNFNCYETKELANKASPMMKRSNAIITACLQVDPDFVPDYLSSNQEHYYFWYEAGSIGHEGGWRLSKSYTLDVGPCVSTQEKWHEAAALLKEWGIE